MKNLTSKELRALYLQFFRFKARKKREAQTLPAPERSGVHPRFNRRDLPPAWAEKSACANWAARIMGIGIAMSMHMRSFIVLHCFSIRASPFCLESTGSHDTTPASRCQLFLSKSIIYFYFYARPTMSSTARANCPHCSRFSLSSLRPLAVME